MALLPTYELILNTSEPLDSETVKTVQASHNQSFALKCSVKGDTHSEPDLHWVKGGNRLVDEESLTVGPSKDGLAQSITISSFNQLKHADLYECQVMRKDNKLHNRRVKVEGKIGKMEFPNGYGPCPPPKDKNHCFNGGICMRHKSSNTDSCLCFEGRGGQRCEHVRSSEILMHPAAKASLIGLGCSVVFLLAIAAVCAMLLYRQRKSMKRIRSKGTLNSSYLPVAGASDKKTDIEMVPLNLDFADSAHISKQQPPAGQQRAFCWHCGYSQTLINGSYQKRPSVIDMNGFHETTPRAGCEDAKGRLPAVSNGSVGSFPRVATLPASPTALGVFFEDFDRTCPECLSELRAHFYPDTPLVQQTPPFTERLPMANIGKQHSTGHHQQKSAKVPKHSLSIADKSQPSKRPLKLDLRPRLPGISDTLEAPKDTRRAASTPSTPERQRKQVDI